MQKYERYQTFYGFANLILFLPNDQRRLRTKGNVISEDRKLKTEPVTGHILVSLGEMFWNCSDSVVFLLFSFNNLIV
jgi:hypothetical protein